MEMRLHLMERHAQSTEKSESVGELPSWFHENRRMKDRKTTGLAGAEASP